MRGATAPWVDDRITEPKAASILACIRTGDVSVLAGRSHLVRVASEPDR